MSSSPRMAFCRRASTDRCRNRSSSYSLRLPFNPATDCTICCTPWCRPHDRVGRKSVLRSMGPGLPRLLARRHPVGVGATSRRRHAVSAVGLDKSASGTCGARASDRRHRDSTAFTDRPARVSASRSGTARATPCRFRSLMSFVCEARPDMSSACSHEIALYNAGRIVYGVGAYGVTRVRREIAMRCGTPGVDGVLSALGHDLAIRCVCTAP
jgi:hypothetical protein